MGVMFAVGVLTHNAIATGRFELLEGTIASLRVAFPGCEPLVLDNGSTDGTAEYVAELPGGVAYVPDDGNTTPGRGENQLVKRLLLATPGLPDAFTIGGRAVGGADIIVCSDDDMSWHPGADDVLRRFWAEAPEDIVLLSGLLEPVWDWNTPRGIVEAGGVRALWRDSAPNAALTFRAADWKKFGPFEETFGQDHKACVAIRERGGRVAQVDLADHAGWGYSSWGNEAIKGARKLDREKWGV